MSTESHAAPSPGPSSRDEEEDEIEQLARDALGDRDVRTVAEEGIQAAAYLRQLGLEPA